ncbi:MAG: hypothetical protein ACU843_15185 [Gammaproteobacteria bacterium]
MFDELISEMEAVRLAKSIPDETSQEEITELGQAAQETSEEAAEETLGKSFQVTLDDGSTAEAIDGTEMLKSFTDRVEALEGAAQTRDEGLQKALGSVVETIKHQHELIKSLSDQVQLLRGAGRGRRSVVTLAEPPEVLKKSETMDSEEFMAKALSAQRDGRVTSIEIASAEAYLNEGRQVPETIVRKVLSA